MRTLDHLGMDVDLASFHYNMDLFTNQNATEGQSFIECPSEG